jgi:hypothetical protein
MAKTPELTIKQQIEQAQLAAANALREEAESKALDAARVAAERGPLFTEAAARYIGKAPGTLAIMLCSGLAPRCEYAAGRPIFHKRDLDAWLANNPNPRKGSVTAGRPRGKRSAA